MVRACRARDDFHLRSSVIPNVEKLRRACGGRMIMDAPADIFWGVVAAD